MSQPFYFIGKLYKLPCYKIKRSAMAAYDVHKEELCARTQEENITEAAVLYCFFMFSNV